MGIRIFYIISIIYGVISSTGILKKELPIHYLYILSVIAALYYIFYANKRKIEFYYTVIAAIIINISVQLTGGINSHLFFAYPAILPIIGYKDKYMNYWIIALCLFVAETLSAVFSHDVIVLRLAILAIAVLVFGVVIKKHAESEAFLKKSLIKFESRDKFFGPADFESKAITTLISDIDRHRGVERPLLFFVKLVHNMFDAYSTGIFSYYNNYLTLIQGFSHSELFKRDAVIDLESGIYRQIISEVRPILIKEFVQNPDELGYYRGEIKIASVMIAPIVLLNKVEGMLIIDRKDEQFTEDDKRLFDEVANATGYLLAMLRLYEKEWYKSRYLDSIAGFAERLHKGLEVKKILSDALNLFKDVLECNDISIAQIDELNNIGVVRESTNVKKGSKFSLDDGLVGFIVRHRNFVIKEDLSKGNLVVFKKGVKVRNLSFIGVPILQEDSVLGVIWCEDHRKEKFSEEDVEALNILASHLSLVWQRAIRHEKIKEQAARDGLTGLYNHRCFQEMLEEEMNKGRELVLILFDIDHFKKVNDTYGHQAGDEVIKFLGRLISQTGIAARYGGEEFAIILTKCSLKKGIDQAVRIKDHLLKSEIKFKQLKIKITVSIGISHYPSDAQTRVELIEKADKALYRAKETGRDKVVVAQTME